MKNYTKNTKYCHPINTLDECNNSILALAQKNQRIDNLLRRLEKEQDDYEVHCCDDDFSYNHCHSSFNHNYNNNYIDNTATTTCYPRPKRPRRETQVVSPTFSAK